MLQCPLIIVIIIAKEPSTSACRQKLLAAATCRYNAQVAWIQAQLRKLNDSPLSPMMSMSWHQTILVQMLVKGLFTYCHLPEMQPCYSYAHAKVACVTGSEEDLGLHQSAWSAKPQGQKENHTR